MTSAGVLKGLGKPSQEEEQVGQATSSQQSKILGSRAVIQMSGGRPRVMRVASTSKPRDTSATLPGENPDVAADSTTRLLRERKPIISKADIGSVQELSGPLRKAVESSENCDDETETPQQQLKEPYQMSGQILDELICAKKEIEQLKSKLRDLESSTNKKKKDELARLRDEKRNVDALCQKLRKDCNELQEAWKQSQRTVIHLEQMVQNFTEQRKSDIEYWAEASKEIDKRLETSKLTEVDLRSAIQKLNHTIAYTHSKNEFHKEKDDAYFHDGFGNLESSIQRWALSNFRGLAKLPPVLAEICPRAFPACSAEVSATKEVQLWIRHFVIFVILQNILQESHCGIQGNLAVAVELVLSYFPAGLGRTRWRANMLYHFLQNPVYQQQSESTSQAVVQLLEEVLAPFAHPSSRSDTRTRTMSKIVRLAIELSKEAQLLSSSIVKAFLPDCSPELEYEPETMISSDITGEEDPSLFRVQGTLFPLILKETFGEKGDCIQVLIRKRTVHIGLKTAPLAVEKSNKYHDKSDSVVSSSAASLDANSQKQTGEKNARQEPPNKKSPPEVEPGASDLVSSSCITASEYPDRPVSPISEIESSSGKSVSVCNFFAREPLPKISDDIPWLWESLKAGVHLSAFLVDPRQYLTDTTDIAAIPERPAIQNTHEWVDVASQLIPDLNRTDDDDVYTPPAYSTANDNMIVCDNQPPDMKPTTDKTWFDFQEKLPASNIIAEQQRDLCGKDLEVPGEQMECEVFQPETDIDGDINLLEA